MDWMTNPEAWIAFGTLLALEIVLGHRQRRFYLDSGG